MVAVKERLKKAARKAVKELKMNEIGRGKGLNIFVESDKVSDNGASRKPTTHKSGVPLYANASKSCIKQSENNRKLLGNGAKSNTGRKVLADIGNVKPKVFGSIKGKSPLHLTTNLLDKTNMSNMARTSIDKRTQRNNITAVSHGRGNANIHSHTSATFRKSLPILQQDYSLKSDSVRGKNEFAVKASVRRSIEQKPTNLSSRPWGNRVSDGFVLMAKNAQTKNHSGSLPKKLPKPAGKTVVTGQKSRRNSTNSSMRKNNLSCRPEDLSKVKKVQECSELKIVPSVSSHANSSKEEDIPDTNLSRRKSDRRNSFTSSLIMSIPKLLRESKSVTPSSTLPQIYDENNHLEVSDYVDDIYQYYWFMEGQNPLPKNYMENQLEITPQMRGILINWLIEVHLRFDLMEETLFLTISLLDRYLSLENIKKNEMQLVGLTVLLLASKYEDFWHPRVADLISISAEPFNRDQMLKMEKTILKKLKFRLNEPTPYVFMLRFLKAAQSKAKKFEHLAFYILELCLVEYEAQNYKPSMLCASAIYVARCTIRMTPIWNPVLAKHTRYEESQIRECAEMVLRFHKGAKTNLLKVACEKYMKPRFGMVAAIKPLDKLPPAL